MARGLGHKKLAENGVEEKESPKAGKDDKKRGPAQPGPWPQRPQGKRTGLGRKRAIRKRGSKGLTLSGLERVPHQEG